MNDDLMTIRKEDLINNPTTRLPVCLCVDVSYSMNAIVSGETKPTGELYEKDGKKWEIVEGGTTAIQELQKGIDYFFDAIKNDEIARYSAEVSIVAFNDNVQTILEFSNIDRQEVPKLTASGSTCMGLGVETTLENLNKRMREYSDKGVDYYKPWLVLMTDGEPTDNITNAVNMIKKFNADGNITLFPVAIGDEANISTLKKFSTLKDGAVLKVQSAEYFQQFFEWLSQSVSVVSQSVPGEKVVTPRPQDYDLEIEL